MIIILAVFESECILTESKRESGTSTKSEMVLFVTTVKRLEVIKYCHKRLSQIKSSQNESNAARVLDPPPKSGYYFVSIFWLIYFVSVKQIFLTKTRTKW